MTRVRNVHERVIAADIDRVGALLDRLASDDDPIWPSPPWPPVRFDRPLSVGATGGHGPISYAVVAYEPGRRIRFDFPAPDTGFHELSVRALDEHHTLVRHELESDAPGLQMLTWVLAIRWLHDALLEDLLDNVQHAVGDPVPRPARWSPWVRLVFAASRLRPGRHRPTQVSGVTPRSP